MRARLYLIVAFLLSGGLIVLGAFLPGQIAERFDALLLDKVELQALAPGEEALSDTTPRPTTAPLINRLKLLTMSPSEVLTTWLENGGRLNNETIREALDREMDELRSRDLYPTSKVLESSSSAMLFSARADFCVAPSQPDLNAIIWQLQLSSEDFSATFYLDDESEKIISYSVRYMLSGEALFSARSGEDWLAYLGLPADGLQVTQEEDDFLKMEGGEEAKTEIVSPGEGVFSVDEKMDSAVGDSGTFMNRFRFTLAKGTSSLDFYCEQFGNKTESHFALELLLPKDEPRTGTSNQPLPHTAGPDAIR
jgi:hypothetical protein